MRSKTLTLLTLLAVLVGVEACGGGITPAPALTPNEATSEPMATVQPTPSPEAPGQPTEAEQPAAAWEEAPCPMDLPAGAVEGEHITCGYVTVPEVMFPR
jgi:hypothetical protein